MKIKELRVIYSTGIFNTRRIRLPLAMNILEALFVVVKRVKSRGNLKVKKEIPPFGRDERRENEECLFVFYQNV